MTEEITEQETSIEKTNATNEQGANMEHVAQAEEGLYETAQQIAQEKVIKLSEAIVEAASEKVPEVSQCLEEGFRGELTKTGIAPPEEVRWVLGVLDNLPEEVVVGTKLEPYLEARKKAEQTCELLAGAEEALEQE